MTTLVRLSDVAFLIALALAVVALITGNSVWWVAALVFFLVAAVTAVVKRKRFRTERQT